MGFINHVKIWEDVRDVRLDEESAPNLGAVHLGKEPPIYNDPVEFFKRTLITRYMAEALENIVSALRGEGGSRLIILSSLFGGGKTHTLLTIYHAVRKPAALFNAEAEDSGIKKTIENFVEKFSDKAIEDIGVVVLDGQLSELAPTPVNPLTVRGGYKVQTIWGSLAHQLGRFDIVRNNDEKLVAPPVDVLLKVLEGRPVLILIDELVHYVTTLRSSVDEALRNYAEQVVAFIETLSKAVVDSSNKTILVISMPVEERDKEGLVIEERYRSAGEVIKSILRSITRVAAKRIMPIAPSDIPSVLKTRIFESIDEKAAKATASKMKKLYSSDEWKEILGEEAVNYADSIAKTYPFHPSYINTLIDMLSKHEVLEKTRDAIRITRMIVRSLVKSESNAELIMPFHIDVEDREIRDLLFHHMNYQQFEIVVNEDIVKRTNEFSRPELAKAISKAILVRTFVYTGSKSDLQFYPDKHEVIVSSYEPAMAQALDLQPKDYVNALEWISNNLVYLLSENEKYWFTQVVTPIRRVEMESKNVDDRDALVKVEEYAWKLLNKPFSAALSSSRKRGEIKTVKTPFSIGSSKVLLEPKPVDNDSREYILLAVLTPINKKEDIERVMYETPSGGRRKYANTIYLIYPGDSTSLSEVMSLAKSLIACGKVSEELETLYQDSDIREVMKKKLEKYCMGEEGIEGRLLVNILNILNTVAYPYWDENKMMNAFKTTRASAADTIAETATRALRNTQPPKLYEALDFDTLHHFISQIGIDISEGDTGKQVSDIIDYFYSNPRLPMAQDGTVKDALIEGVKMLKIGVRRSGKVYFKKIYSCNSVEDCIKKQFPSEGETLQSLEPSDIVLPWRIALQEQLESLKDIKEEKVPDGIKRTWYGVIIENNVKKVQDALRELDPQTLLNAPIVMITETMREGVDIKLERYEVESLPGEEIVIGALIERIGSFAGEVIFSATYGELSTEKASINDESPSAEISWRMRAPADPGEYTYELKASNPSGEVLKSTAITVTVKPTGKKKYNGIPPKGTKISSIEVEVPSKGANLKPIALIDAKFGSMCEVAEAKLELESGTDKKKTRISMTFEHVSTEDLKSIFPVIIQRYSIFAVQAKYRIVLRPRSGNYIEAPEFGSESKDLENYISYEVFEGG